MIGAAIIEMALCCAKHRLRMDLLPADWCGVPEDLPAVLA